jgi:hypothetical protein
MIVFFQIYFKIRVKGKIISTHLSKSTSLISWLILKKSDFGSSEGVTSTKTTKSNQIYEIS